jgi:hypothetical protein
MFKLFLKYFQLLSKYRYINEKFYMAYSKVTCVVRWVFTNFVTFC